MIIATIFSSLTAICFSYAFMMSIVKKEHNATWLRGEAVFTLLFTGISFGMYWPALVGGQFYASLAAVSLLFALGNALGLVILHRMTMQNDKALYPEHSVKTTKLLGSIIFLALVAHLLLLIASFAWS